VVKGLCIDSFAGVGLLFVSGGSDAAVQDYIGTDLTGSTAFPNGTGLLSVISNGDVVVSSVISGNTGYGVELAASNGNVVVLNTLGLNAVNTAAVPNFVGIGVLGGSTGNVIASNNIAGNGDGVLFTDAGTDGNTLEGNTIGTLSSGASFPNTVNGVVLQNGASGNVIGGNVAADRNLISDNGTD